MAEIWYLELGTEKLDNETKQERPFLECVALLELEPDDVMPDLDAIPDLRTGNPFVDIGGRVNICVRVFQAELDGVEDSRWKPGWYKSDITVIGMAKKLKTIGKKLNM
ncbi:MAG: hypothetical protein DHS20C13_27020 [Thermodesulfobacteriota bacterium]|nr:MAG: hypothetical protein DHS20C13_27020 [Thermodesulfobacteriota bacterium]